MTPPENEPDLQTCATSSPQPILPAILTSPWAFLTFWVLPIGVLFLVSLRDYSLISGNMDEGERTEALWLGLSLVSNLTMAVLFFIWAKQRHARHRSVILLALAPLIVNTGYLFHATTAFHLILPSTVAPWIYSAEQFFYFQYSLAMVPLGWAIIILAGAQHRFAPQNLLPNLIIGIVSPMALFVTVLAFSQSRIFYEDFSVFWSSWGPILFFSITAVLGMAMFYGILRFLLLLLARINLREKPLESVITFLIAALLPLCGLSLNSLIPFPNDFQATAPYLLTVVNAVFLITAIWLRSRLPRLCLFLLGSTLPFTLYFFFVFLPYTPLSILAVVVAGFGFLVLSPTLLLALHLRSIHQIASILPSRRCLLPLLLGALILPGAFLLRTSRDRQALNQALEYQFSPDFSAPSLTYQGSLGALRSALQNHRDHKNGIYYPLLSDLYSWLVFNNLVLPDEKLSILEGSFFNQQGSSKNVDPMHSPFLWGRSSVRNRRLMPSAPPPPREVKITAEDLHLKPIDAFNTLATYTIELTNFSHSTFIGAEAIRLIELLPGAFITGFRLNVAGVPVSGKLFEKKTALWVYSMIRDTERRDPGLLFYNRPDELELRVFPILKQEPAIVGIDFHLPGPITALEITSSPGNPNRLAVAFQPETPLLSRGANYTFLTPPSAESLPLVPDRPKYLHLIVDRSINHGIEEELADLLSSVSDRFPALAQARLFMANFEVLELTRGMTPIAEITVDHPRALKEAMPLRGRLDLNRAITHGIHRHTEEILDTVATHNPLPPEPIFVVLSKGTPALKPSDSTLEVARFQLGDLEIYSTTDGTTLELISPQPDKAATSLVRVGSAIRPVHPGYPLIFPQSDAPPEYFDPTLQQWMPLPHLEHPPASPWHALVALWVENQRYEQNPGSPETNLESLVRQSRASGLLLPATSYLVVENQAQWRILERKQKQKLGAHEALEFLETPAPPFLILFLGYTAWHLTRRPRRDPAGS
ncbi:MAG: MSEP-CTERM sorting domain-containing protein [Puniceicoccaceae bacterium]